MKVSARVLKVAGVALGVLGVGALGYFRVYQTPRAELVTKLTASREKAAGLEKQLEEKASVSRRLKEFGSQTLGKKEDQVVDRFRNGLSKIAEECGLVAVKTNTGAPKAVPNPLLRNNKVQGTALKRALKKTPDFQVIAGTVEGVGSLEQVLKAIAVVQAQPWVHRMEGFSIATSGKERDRFTVRLEVATILASDLAPVKDVDLTQSPPLMGAEAIWRAIAARNPFKEPPQAVPPPVVVAAATPTPQGPTPPAPPPPPPYADWRLTSIVSTARGTEAWLVNVKTNEREVLTVGGKLIDAVFKEGTGERAVFEISGQKFELFNGQTFTSRRLLN